MDLHCDCGKRLIVNEGHIGRTVRCPTCGKAQVVRAASGPAPRRPAGRPGPPGGALPLLMRGLAVLLLLAAAVTAAWWLWGRQAAEVDDLALVPTDAAVVVVLDVADLWGRPAVKDDLAKLVGLARTNLGLRPDEVRRLSLVAHAPDDRLGWVVIRTLGEIDRPRVLARLGDYQQRVYARRPLYIGTIRDETDAEHEVAVAFVRPDVMVASNQVGVKHALGLLTRRQINPGPLAPVLAEARTRPVTLGLSAGPWWEGVSATAPELVRPLVREMRFASLGIELEEKAQLSGRLAVEDEAGAAMAARTAKKLLAVVQAAPLLPLRQPGPVQQALTDLSELLGSAAVEPEGAEVRFRAEGDPARLMRAIAALVVNGPPWGQ